METQKNADIDVPLIPLLRPNVIITETSPHLICFTDHTGLIGRLEVDSAGKKAVDALLSLTHNGTHQIEELTAACKRRGMHPRKTRHILQQLYLAGICVDLQDATDECGAVPRRWLHVLRKWSRFTSRPGRILSLLQRSTVEVYDDCGLGESIARDLGREGFGHALVHQPIIRPSQTKRVPAAVHGADIVIAVSAQLDTLLNLNRQSVLDRVPFAAIQICSERMIAGPLVRPFESACLACAAATVRQNGRLAAATSRPSQTTRARRLHVSGAACAALAELVVDSFAACQGPPQLLNHMIDILPSGELSSHRSIVRGARCQVCSRNNVVPEDKIISREGAADAGQSY